MYHLGQLVIAAATSVNNLTTATPFAIPPGLDSLLLLASGADCYAEVKVGTSARASTAATGVPIGTTIFQAPCNGTAGAGYAGASNVLSVFNNNAGSRNVDVWAVYA